MFSIKKPVLIGLISIVLLGSNTNYAETIIHAGKLIDGQKDSVQSKMTIVINDNLITDVIKGYKDPTDNDIYLDLKGQTVLPGLMDMHVHFGGEYQSKAERPIKVEKEMEAILASEHARVTSLPLGRLETVVWLLSVLEMPLIKVKLLVQEFIHPARV